MEAQKQGFSLEYLASIAEDDSEVETPGWKHKPLVSESDLEDENTNDF